MKFSKSDDVAPVCLMGDRRTFFEPNAQQCDDCGAIDELSSAACSNCGSGGLRPIKLAKKRPAKKTA
jgi:hypothetical protein